jgi:hypothetical protein
VCRPTRTKTGPEVSASVSGGGSESRGRSRECHEERVALRMHLNPPVAGTRLTDDPPVCGKRLRIALRSQVVQELRRPLDIREEESDCAGRKLPMHAP